jgi:DNA-binding response OmpR family regulator
MSLRLLLVEDDKDLARGLSFNLEQEGYVVVVAPDVAAARRAMSSPATRPALVVLDLSLPDGDGLDLVREWRRERAPTPVICLTARSQESDVVAGLKLGADDYVTKPFGLAQLFARIEAVLRRTDSAAAATGVAPPEVDLGGVCVDLATHRVSRPSGARGGSHVEELTPIEAELLRYFLARRGRVLERAQILKDLWGVEDRRATRTLDNHVARLRRKIEADPAKPRFLVTVHGLGYRFEADAG